MKTKTKNSKFTKVLNEKFNGDVRLLLDDLERFAIKNGEQYEVADKILKNKFPNIPESPIGIKTKVNRYFDENSREIDLYTIQNNKLIKTGEASLPYDNEVLKILLSGGTLKIPERFLK